MPWLDSHHPPHGLHRADRACGNIYQESQEFLSVMRHQLRAAKKFMEK